jgi:hypothetical protein
MDSANGTFNAKLYWRIVLCRQFLQAQAQPGDADVEALLAFFDREPTSQQAPRRKAA